MNRIIWFPVTEKEKYPLCYTLGAAKVVQAKWGGINGFLSAAEEAMKGLDFQPLLFCMNLLIRQGCSRLNTFYKDYPAEPGAVLTEDGLYTPIHPDDFAAKIKVYQIHAVPGAVVAAHNLAIKETISASLTAQAREAMKNTESSGKLAWYDYHARSFGISMHEYNLMTIGEIQDLAVCRAIQRGLMTEDIDSPYLPRYK